MNDPLDSAIPVGAGPGQTVPPQSPPPVAPAPRTAPSGNDKIWACLSHASFLLGFGVILPLIVYIAMKEDSAYVRSNAKEALNFHLCFYFYAVVAVLLCLALVGVPLLFAIAIGSLILTIIATMKAADGECYRYPFTLRLIK